jgi:DNA-directed RNA polymerase specialized sigma24 family protein
MAVDMDKLHAENVDMVSERLEILKEETMLSDREAEAVACKTVGMTADDVADAMGVEESTVNEYLKRARTKAHDGFETYDALRFYGIVERRD